MEFRHLKYFVVLAEELHFGRAAQRLCITQPPLSFNIKQLEAHLGVQLFIRDSRKVTLTPTGQAFLGEARQVLAQAARAEQTVRAVSGGQMGKLRLGFTSSMIYRGMPELLDTFASSYPQVEYQLVDAGVGDQAQAMRQGDLDGGFMPSMAIPAGLSGQRLFEDRYVCCVPDGHWAADMERLPLSRLADETFILFAREFTPSGHEYVLSLCVNAGFHPKAGHYVRQWLAALALVSKGMGISLMPSSMVKAGLPGVRFVAIDEAKPYHAFFVWNPEQVSPALKVFAAHLRRTVREAKPVSPGSRRRSTK
ncbi:MAG: LysR substrate-binding domain-containing protein [Burkholderiaceae bacterium]|nr:LysR substrate-binding domain-containing protein [Burkholderiaceae bacterium]